MEVRMLALLPLLGPVIERLAGMIPDPQQRARAIAEAQQQMLDALRAQDASQAEINKIEAASSSWFVAGWRPFIGWICGAALAWAFVIGPVAKWLVTVAGISATVPPTAMDGNLWELVFAMLGIGGLRTFEKVRGVANGQVAAGQAVSR
jgi:hypothetical protein